MGFGSGKGGGAGRAVATPWNFIYNTDKAEGGLMVLFFGLVFSVGIPPEIFRPTPLFVTYASY